MLDEVLLNGSPVNAPVIWPTLQVGTDALALAALSLLSKSSGAQTSKEVQTTSAP